MRLKSKMNKVFLPLCVSLMACAPVNGVQTDSVQSKLSSTSNKKTACLSFQGNGVYFSSHVGALIALLENNYEPVLSTGGSSGAILASVSRALVENPSLRGADGTFAPQQAARLLASSAPVIESVLFLPRFTTPLSLLDSFDVFFSGSAVGVLRADPKDALVHAESIVGQATLVVEFYRSVDFSKVIVEKDLAERERKMAALWRSFSDAIRVSPEEFADAIFVPRTQLVAEGKDRVVQIQDRFFRLYRSKQDNMINNFRTRQEAWNELLAGNFKVFGLDNPEKRRTLLKNILEAIRGVESFDSLAATLSGDFLLADPDRVYRAFDGFDSRTGRAIEIPSNVIIHSTARRAVKKVGEWFEVPGLESLHQVYMSNPSQVARNAQILLNPANNPIQPADKSKMPVIPTERLVVTGLELGPALAATTGEPTAFIRFPVRLDPKALERSSWVSSQEQLIGSGGWLEKVSLGTGTKFEECAAHNVDLYFSTSDGEGINRFAKMVFLGLFLDKPLRGLLAQQIQNPNINLSALLSGEVPNNKAFEPPADKKKSFDGVLESVDGVFSETRKLMARRGHLPVNFNYVNPVQIGGNSVKAVNTVFRSNRRAMILGAYEFTRKLAQERGLAGSSVLLWNKPLDSVLKQTKPQDVLAIVSDTLPRLSITEGASN